MRDEIFANFTYYSNVASKNDKTFFYGITGFAEVFKNN